MNMFLTCQVAKRLVQQGLPCRVVALWGAAQQQQQQQWQWRSVYSEPIDQREARKADSFYDSTIEKVRLL